MTIMIFGGAGYLGVPLSNRLVEENIDVTVFDKFIYGDKTLLDPKINIIKDDVINVHLYSDYIKTFDLIIYLISPRLDDLKIEDEVEQSLIELDNLINILDKNTYFIFASSCSVYGQTKDLVNENSKTQITSLYSKLKIKSEELLIKTNNPNHKIIRLSTLYGKSKLFRHDLMINRFAYDLKYRKTIDVYDPDVQRPHLHVSDCVKIITQLIKNDEFLKSKNIVLNIGMDELNVSKKQIIKIIEGLIMDKLKINFIYSLDSRSYNVDFSKLNRIYKENVISFNDGIIELLK